MIIETIGSFASIIGLSMQVIDNFQKEHDSPIGKSMASLKALSITGKTWKNVHMKYHAVERNIPRILSTIETIHEGQIEVLDAKKINPSHVKQAFNDPNWLMYIENLEDQLRPNMDTLKHANSSATKEQDAILHLLRNEGHFVIAEKVQTIVISQQKIVGTHDSFISFIKTIKNNLSDPIWDISHVEFVLQNRILLNTQIPMIIGNTDNALMALLDLYNLVIEEVSSK